MLNFVTLSESCWREVLNSVVSIFGIKDWFITAPPTTPTHQTLWKGVCLGKSLSEVPDIQISVTWEPFNNIYKKQTFGYNGVNLYHCGQVVCGTTMLFCVLILLAVLWIKILSICLSCRAVCWGGHFLFCISFFIFFCLVCNRDLNMLWLGCSFTFLFALF